MAEDRIIDNILQGLCAVIFQDSERVLMLYRSVEGEEYKSGWEFVKGGMQVGETRLDAAFREIREETGLSDVELVVELPRVYLVDVQYRKKKYHWIEKKALVFFYQGGEVYLDGKEHSQYRWMSVSEAQEVCWVEYGAEILAEARNAFMLWRTKNNKGSS